MNKAIFYHAGCPVCATAKHQFVKALNEKKYDIEIVHLGNDKSRISEAEIAGVKSVPAILLEGSAFHINFGASLDDVKGAE